MLDENEGQPCLGRNGGEELEERVESSGRRADPDDARGRRIKLTPKAARLQKTLVPMVKKLVARMEAGLGERELEVTKQTLQRLTSNLE